MTNLDTSIVVVGSPDDLHVQSVTEGLRARGHEPYVFDTQRFPEEMTVSLGEQGASIFVDGQQIARPAAVYLRSLYQSPGAYGVDADKAMQDNWRRTLLAFRERSTLMSAVLLRWEEAGTAVYNSPRASANITKPFQLALLRDAGLPVPRSLWTNDPEAVRRFHAEVGDCIYKPVAGGARTRKLEAKDLEADRIERLSAAPVCFQELLTGDDVRVYVIDDQVICALRIVTDEIDFRQAEERIEAIEISDEVKDQCVRAAKLVGLRYTGMDIKAGADGNYRVLELNASAMFRGFEGRANVDICGPLCDALIAQTKR
ncbi:hypothetical protein PPSIR1_03893 [Plesiocystis pacifica SIR-1]|uniref:ATP-grasp domain-containing protein n=2 Tax=Plesiocystis pacifica SIR-1 TaxID=391625 RepID=A6G4D7_9BACT|nr:hypothetical protein [Plesiocystis pacifica]EDM79249.1 hypothetical protein PPSIR1_03893 [Plesiocystis pacifica SIR-1]